MKKLDALLGSPRRPAIVAWLSAVCFVAFLAKVLLTDGETFWTGLALATSFWVGFRSWAEYAQAKRENAEIAANQERIDDLEVQIAVTRDKLNGQGPA